MLRNTEPMPNDHLLLAIMVTIFCCLPLGIVALIKSIQVKDKYKEGDIAGSVEASKSTKRWSIAGVIIGIIMLVVCIVMLIFFIIEQSNRKPAAANPDIGRGPYMDTHSYSSSWGETHYV
ncbi:transmembrane protein 233-like [Diadema setosum]|uniref:transmembrane protein 233-like n=1 Tax=Diadema setosum TaxID=31175 RepID=UPI003B3B5404